MITNFDYLKKDSKFSRFADVAISAEKIILMDPEASILNSRRAMEFAIKWMYSVDSELEMPYQDNLQSLMNAEEYRQIVGPDLWKRMDYIGSSALNTWIFNEDTIKHVLNILMRDGIKIDYGQKLGKTIIFAKNHAHAEKILEIFNKEYPHLTNYANVIDNYMTYAQSAIDEFSDPKKLPQIAISVDM